LPACARYTQAGLFIPVFEAANAEAVRLIVRVPVDIRVGHVQVPFPRITAVGRGRPQVRVRPAIVVTAIGIPVPSEQA